MSEADAQQTAAEAPQDTQVAPQNDALMSRLDEMSQQIQSLAKPPEPQWQGGISDLPYAEGEPSRGFEQQPEFGAAYDPSQYQPGQYEPDYGMDPQAQQAQAMQQLQSYISDQVQQGVQQAITPHIQRQKADELERRYPDLADPQKAGQVVQATAQWAQRMGRPDLARDPELVELVYLAEQARTRAAQETPAENGSSGVHLETGGAAPQGQEEESAGDRMLRAWGIDPATGVRG